MAIIRCPECGKEISSSAPVCPNCGYSHILAPQSKDKTKRNAMIFIAGIVIPFLLMASDAAFIIFVIGGALIELLLTIITIFSGLFFNGKRLFLFFDFILFDFGFGLGVFITFIIKMRSYL